MIQISRLSKQFGPNHLFDQATLEIKPNERIGLIGPNGSGKTTLLRMMCDEEDFDSGTIVVPSSVKIGYLKQDVTLDAKKTLLEEVMHGFPEIAQLEHMLIELEIKISENPQNNELLKKYGQLRDEFEQHEGYQLENRAKAILSGVGFDASEFKTPMKNFSGGWMMRVALARLLLLQPGLLLMDEPTNHLDLNSVIWLENFIKNYPGTIILISHDQYFLNRTATQIVEIEAKKLVSYSGDYDFYLEEKKLRKAQQEAEFKNQQKKIEKTEQFIERFRYKASKAKQVQSRVKKLEKVERIELDAHAKKIKFKLPPPVRSGKIVVELEGIKKQYGHLTVYKSLDFLITRGQKIGLVGYNGAGKSTLLKILAQNTEIQDGTIALGQNVTPYYYAQHQLEILNSKNNILEELTGAAPNLSEQQLRTLAGMFLFINDDVFKKISILSGGEKARVALAKMLANPANFLILDEPTNHLDLAARRVLQTALTDYAGTIIFITHDREFLNGIAQTIVEVQEGTLKVFAGDYEYYLWKKDEETKAESQAVAEAKRHDNARHNKKGDRKRRALFLQEKQRRIGPIQKSLDSLEKDIAGLEDLKESLTSEICEPEIISATAVFAAKNRELNEISKRLDGAYREWETLSAELENQTLLIENEFDLS
ncbi:MAG: ABC transporter ATP-binding protein [Calditrichaeota bacterium]|nr:MAG: ABC transporter ATP-binding protein [Calditrichota bacterium]